MKLERLRDNAVRLTLTNVELTALVAAARMAGDAMERDEGAPRELLDVLNRVLADYDSARLPGAE